MSRYKTPHFLNMRRATPSAREEEIAATDRHRAVITKVRHDVEALVAEIRDTCLRAEMPIATTYEYPPPQYYEGYGFLPPGQTPPVPRTDQNLMRMPPPPDPPRGRRTMRRGM